MNKFYRDRIEEMTNAISALAIIQGERIDRTGERIDEMIAEMTANIYRLEAVTEKLRSDVRDLQNE